MAAPAPAGPPSFEDRLGAIRVGLRKDLVFTRHDMSGSPRYVVHDPVTYQNHVFNLLEYRILTEILRHRSLAQCFASLVAAKVLREADNDAFYRFVLSLHGMHLLQLPISQADTLFNRYTAKRAARTAGWYRAVMFWKLPLWNPDPFLTRTLRWFGWLFGRTGLVAWVLLMALVVWNCLGRFGELFGESGALLQLGNLPLLWLALVLLKAIHEFGHAYACKRFGGDVPEMGITFIVMTPCAYVDASASWKFSSRWHRIAVASAGMFVESMIAGIFALIWVGTGPGVLHELALNVVMLAGIVTVFLNINPLMKYDGYFIFSDLLNVLNLRERADACLAGWARRTFLGLPAPTSRHRGFERWVYALYAPASFVYKLTLAFTITGMVIVKWAATGLILGALFAWMMIVQPLARLARYLLESEATAPVRARARLVAVAAASLTILALVALPVSSSIVVPGVLDAAERVSIRAAAGGFVTEVLTHPGAVVAAGQGLCALENPGLELQRARMVGEAEADAIRLDVEELQDATRAASHRSRLQYLRQRVAQIDARLAAMQVAAPRGGMIVDGDLDTLQGRYVHQGDELMRLLSRERLVRVVLSGDDIARAFLEVGAEAEVRWTSDPTRAIRATVREIRRSASRTEVPVELTMLAGGDLHARPIGNDGVETDQPYLHVFLEPASMPADGVLAGLTARVRFAAQMETLGGRIRRVLLGLYNTWKMS